MIWPGLTAGVVLSYALWRAEAQSNPTTSATCTNSSFTWSYNSNKQDPCLIATQLGSVCTDAFLIQPLQPGFVYQGPTLENSNPCRCSSVFYSLVSACAACQDRNWLNWTRYKTNCTTVYSTVFPDPLPPGTVVPNYAYLDVSAQDTFNATAAQLDIGGPESTGSVSPTSSPTSSTTSTSSGKKSNTGAIAGGVIGGVVFVALVAGLIIWLLRRRRNSGVAPSQPASDQMAPVTFNTTGSYLPPSTPRLYNPSDPSTFPSSFSTPPNNIQNSPYMNTTLTGSTQPTVNHTTRYTGAPEL